MAGCHSLMHETPEKKRGVIRTIPPISSLLVVLGGFYRPLDNNKWEVGSIQPNGKTTKEW